MPHDPYKFTDPTKPATHVRVYTADGLPRRVAPPKPGAASRQDGRELRAMILQALSDEGGVAYLRAQAYMQPVAFLALLGKVLPKDVNLDTTGLEQLADRLAAARLQAQPGRPLPPIDVVAQGDDDETLAEDPDPAGDPPTDDLI